MKQEKRFQTIDGATSMSQSLKPLNFVVDSLLPQGLHILAGSPKVGKSWLALWLSVMVRPMISSAGSPHKHYTATEIKVANDTDLPELLEHLGYHVRRVGSCCTAKEMDSLRIWNRRTWFRYSEAVGGDAVAFLRHFCGMTFPEAVGRLAVKFGERGFGIGDRVPPSGKDWNEYLQTRGGL